MISSINKKMQTPKNRNKDKLKLRTFFKSKKQVKIGRSSLNPELNAKNQNYQQSNSEQKACWTLMEQSLVNTDYQLSKEEPDTCLMLTPRPVKKNTQTISPSSKGNTITPKEKLKSQTQIKIVGQRPPSFETQNKSINVCQNSRVKTNIEKPNLFIGKQVLCVTQYIVAGSDWNQRSLQLSRKQQCGRYIKVLKQMKSRNEKKRNSQSLQPQKTKSFLSSFFQALREESQTLQRINFNQNKTNKQRRSNSLRANFKKSPANANSNRCYFRSKQPSKQKMITLFNN